MARKKAMGRPSGKVLPPRIDATPEEVAYVVLNAGRPKGPVANRLYHCQDCTRQVPSLKPSTRTIVASLATRRRSDGSPGFG